MDVWNLILYVVASLLALKSLVSLMTHHKKVVVQQLAVEYTQEISSGENKPTDGSAAEQPAGLVSADNNASAA